MSELDVVVVGSCMVDLICYAPRLPKSGETLCGSNFKMGLGGKGCNQCVAAKKLGANCLLVARIGNDFFGANYSSKLLESGLTSKHFKITNGVPTGMAQITVADTGENQIVIVLGANEKLTETDVEEATDAIINCKVLLCQLEISENSTIKALKIKSDGEKAPAKSNLNPLLFSLPDIFCVNESEAEVLTDLKSSDLKSAEEAVRKLLSKGCKNVIITLGERGSVYGGRESSKIVYVPAIKVNAVDTTGAGDAFLGALAYYLATRPDLTMEEMIKRASGVAAYSVQKSGTQESFPGISDLPPYFYF